MKSASTHMLETPLVTFSTMRQALAALGEPHSVTALYVSSGRDTKPFAFLHPMFLTERGLMEVPAPSPGTTSRHRHAVQPCVPSPQGPAATSSRPPTLPMTLGEMRPSGRSDCCLRC